MTDTQRRTHVARQFVAALSLVMLGAMSAHNAQAVELIPSVGMTKSTDKDAGDAKAFGGLALRASLLPFLKLEGGIGAPVGLGHLLKLGGRPGQVPGLERRPGPIERIGRGDDLPLLGHPVEPAAEDQERHGPAHIAGELPVPVDPGQEGGSLVGIRGGRRGRSG